ncbi:hypothetical protein ACFOYW_17055 [Gryllotalpicola reticulitermitis]|uniref:Uncharacterized protein n=1 Tax=Gryllotalpicola reticulitermitis TaxID=1184153 RepID=A0ABV8QDL3_9MICO
MVIAVSRGDSPATTLHAPRSRAIAARPSNRAQEGPSALYGAQKAARRGGLILRPALETYSRVPACDPEAWLVALEAALAQPAVERLRRSRRMSSRELILACARELAAAADFRTGRNVAVSRATIAEAIKCAPGTVKEILQFLTRIGFQLVVCRGANRLTLEQLTEARELGGTAQRAVASTRFLTIPRWARQLLRVAPAVDAAPLPSREKVKQQVAVKEFPPTRAARAEAASRPQLRRMKGRSVRRARSPRPMGLQQLAAQLASRMPWLARGVHIGALCDALARAGIRPEAWTAAALLDLVNQHLRSQNVTVAEPETQRDPVAYFAWMLRAAVDVDAETPVERQRRQAIEAAERRRQEAASRIELERRAVPMDRAEFERLTALHAAQRRTFDPGDPS